MPMLTCEPVLAGQVSVLTIDTNPPPAFTRCATNLLNAARGVRNAE